MANKLPVVVIGSGVIGLTTALCLQRLDRYQVTIVARHLIEDLSKEISQDWASPFAGANFFPFSNLDDDAVRLAEELTYFRFRDLAAADKTSGVQTIDLVDFGMASAECPRHYLYRGYARNLEQLDRSQWARDAKYGYKFESLIFNVPKYLDWLLRQFKELGGQVVRANIKHIDDVALQFGGPSCRLVVNCTAMGSKWLGGVIDNKVLPGRGQTVLVRAPAVSQSVVAPGSASDKPTYIIPRGDGTVILGGVNQPYSDNREVDKQTTEEILRNCLELCPPLIDKSQGSGYWHSVTPEDIEKLRSRIIRVNVAFRPVRQGGPRVQVEQRKQKSGDAVTVVHNYGHGGYGYQTSWGYANMVVRMLDKAVVGTGNAKL